MNKVSLPYRCFRSFIRFFTDNLYYSDVRIIGLKNVPAPGIPSIIASNHFNSMNDALGILFSLKDRKPSFIVRADVFSNPLANRFLRSIGLLPAYRMDFEGKSAMSSNSGTFAQSETALMDGGTVVIFPQAGHSCGYWMDSFTVGMAKMAFEAASREDFKKEILIVPSCNYYRDYRRLYSDMLIKYGEPVGVSHLYDLYRQKPRSAMRRLNDLIAEKIRPMMLDIRDWEYYSEIRFILDGGYVPLLAGRLSLDNSNIEDNLTVCKKIAEGIHSALVAEDPFLPSVVSHRGESAEHLKQKAAAMRMASMERAGVASAERGETAALLQRAALLKDELSSLRLEDSQFENNLSLPRTLLEMSLLFILLPLAAVCLWPSALCFIIPEWFSRRMKNNTFRGTFMIALNILFILPLTALATILLVAPRLGIWAALLYVALFPAICLFEMNYAKRVIFCLRNFRWLRARSAGKTKRAEALRKELFSGLDKIFNQSV